MARDSRPPLAGSGIGADATSTTRPPREYAETAKRALRMALDLAGLSAADLGRALGEHEDTCEAWCNALMRNHVPAWVLLHPRLPAPVRAHLEAVIAASAGTRPLLCAATVEGQANVVAGGVGKLLALASEHLSDGSIDATEAADELPVVRQLVERLTAYEARLVGVVSGSR